MSGAEWQEGKTWFQLYGLLWYSLGNKRPRQGMSGEACGCRKVGVRDGTGLAGASHTILRTRGILWGAICDKWPLLLEGHKGGNCVALGSTLCYVLDFPEI